MNFVLTMVLCSHLEEEFDMFCSDECKQEALADLDKDSDECLSCQ